MKRLILVTFILTITFGCNQVTRDNITYRPLSEFLLDSTAAKTGDRLKLLAFSGTKNDKENIIYYSQVLAINETTTDTVLVLCPLLKIPPLDIGSSALYILPLEFNPSKKILEAVYNKKTDSLNILFQTLGNIDNNFKEGTQKLDQYLKSLPKSKELVAENKSMSIFDHKYKTLVGILEFDTDPR